VYPVGVAGTFPVIHLKRRHTVADESQHHVERWRQKRGNSTRW
jgi:hypothetical protein